MYIPSELGYGDSGSPPKIGGGDVLVFIMEIIKINGDKVDAITCDPATTEGCNDKEKAYVTKATGKYGGDKDKIQAELDRLGKMAGKDMKPELQGWINRRKNILTKVRTPGRCRNPLACRCGRSGGGAWSLKPLHDTFFVLTQMAAL